MLNALLVSDHQEATYFWFCLSRVFFFCPIRRTSPAGLNCLLTSSRINICTAICAENVFHSTAIAIHYSMFGIETYLFASGHVPHGDVAMVCPHRKLVASFTPRHRGDSVCIGTQIAQSRHLKVQINDSSNLVQFCETGNRDDKRLGRAVYVVRPHNVHIPNINVHCEYEAIFLLNMQSA